MVRVAVAGGTGGVGRTLVDEFAQSNDHVIFVLSRKSELPFKAPTNVHCLAAPYDNVDNLIKLLETNDIHTVISTMSPPIPEVHAAQDNLIRAAAQSTTVKRFVPSEWGIDYSADDEHLPLSWKALKRQSFAELEKQPKLEFTGFDNGYFMDYFGMPQYQSYMTPEMPFVDLNALKAAIPGSGDDLVTWTLTRDVAKFVRRMVESDDPWPRRSTKFDVVNDSLEDLRAGKISEIPAYLPLYEIFPKEMFLETMAGLGVAMITGLFAFKGELINDKYPDIQPAKLRDFIKTHWQGK
ncbi:MAG: hypothetical protein Q9179_002155 [Wetmoreana sp. 5 TL-2023]